jgi:hypothetical protein
LLTTLLRIHTTARRHCEAARRQQARVTAGGPSFDDRTRAGAEKFGPNQPPRRLHAPERSPPRHREVPEGGLHWRSSFRCRSLRCATHSTIHAKNAKSVFHRESNPLPHVPKVFDLPTGPKRSWILESFREMISNGYETRLTYHVTYPGTQGTVSTQSTPPSEGQSHPGRPGPLRAWVGAPRPGPAKPANFNSVNPTVVIASVAMLWRHRHHLHFVLRGSSAQAWYSRATSAVSSRLLLSDREQKCV